MPRAAVPDLVTPGASIRTQDDAAPLASRGDMRRRILALLRDYPEGLTPAEMRTLLRAGKRLANTCIAMRRDGLLRRVGRGRYVGT